MEMIEIEKIRIDGGTQQRELSDDKVGEYADLIRDGSEPPPPVLFHDGGDYWLADGFHRFFASRKAGGKSIKCDVRHGTKRDAILYSLTEANSRNGLPLTKGEKRKRVELLLKDEEWGKWSKHEIAKKSCVSVHFVSDVRKSLFPDDSEISKTRVYTNKNGVVSTMNTANIGKGKQAAKPAAPLKYDPIDDDEPIPGFDDVPAPAKPAAPAVPAKPALPWADLDAKIEPLLDELDSLARRLGTTLELTKDNERGKWSRFMSYQATAGAVRTVRRHIEENRPGQLSIQAPGYIPVRQVKLAIAVKGGK